MVNLAFKITKTNSEKIIRNRRARNRSNSSRKSNRRAKKSRTFGSILGDFVKTKSSKFLKSQRKRAPYDTVKKSVFRRAYEKQQQELAKLQAGKAERKNFGHMRKLSSFIELSECGEFFGGAGEGSRRGLATHRGGGAREQNFLVRKNSQFSLSHRSARVMPRRQQTQA